MTSLDVTLGSTAAHVAPMGVHLYATSDRDRLDLDTAVPLGSRDPAGVVVFGGLSETLVARSNYFWVTVTPAPRATLGQIMHAHVADATDIQFSNDATTGFSFAGGDPSAAVGRRLRPFAANAEFSNRGLDLEPGQLVATTIGTPSKTDWMRGRPHNTAGPTLEDSSAEGPGNVLRKSSKPSLRFLLVWGWALGSWAWLAGCTGAPDRCSNCRLAADGDDGAARPPEGGTDRSAQADGRDPADATDSGGDTDRPDTTPPGDAGLTGDQRTPLRDPDDGSFFALFPAFVISPMSWRDFSYATEAGAQSTSIYVMWHREEPAAPVGGVHTYQFDSTNCAGTDCLDITVRSAHDSGLVINDIAVLPSMPSWITCADPLCPGAGTIRECIPDPSSTLDLQAFVSAMVERYDGDGVNDMPGLRRGIRYWSIGNELTYPSNQLPNPPPHYDCGAAADYLGLYDAFHAAVKAADPLGRLVSPRPVLCILGHLALGEACNIPQERLDRFELFFDQVDPNKVDVIAIHPYDRWELLPSRLDGFRDYLATSPRNFASKPLWIVENGDLGPGGTPIAGECITAQTDARQAEDVVKRFVPALARGVAHVSWFFPLLVQLFAGLLLCRGELCGRGAVPTDGRSGL